MLFGNGLSALMTLIGISATLVLLFVILPLIFAGRGQARPQGWLAWLAYFGALGAGFMLIEVSVLQRFVLLLGHPVYSLTVTLFSLLLGTGLGAAWSRRFDAATLRRSGAIGIVVIAAIAIVFIVRRHADRQLGDSVLARRADAGGGGDADPDRHRARHPDAGRDADPAAPAPRSCCRGPGASTGPSRCLARPWRSSSR